MNALSRYWKICRISLVREKAGYEHTLVTVAQKLVRRIVSNQNEDIQATLHTHFQNQSQSTVNPNLSAVAGLCLRCYVSYPILKACQKLDSLFAGDNFTYRDLLPFVLNDDGKTPIVLDTDGKTQLILSNNNQTKATAYQFFSVKILQSYDYNSPGKMSLDNWAFLQTKQNTELKNFLSEFGFKVLSDWALLNRTRPKQLERLMMRDRHLVEVFHAVYRQDRRKQKLKGAKKCPEPTEAQLQQMLDLLQERKVVINTTTDVLKALKQVAIQLRQYDLWSYREPLEIQEPESGNYVVRADLPYDSISETDVEQQDLLQFLHKQFQLALVSGLEQEIKASIAKLQKSKKYAPLAPQFTVGLQLYYAQGKSLKEIAPQLGMGNWDRARRVLNPGGLLSKVRTSCIQKLLDSILKMASEKGLTEIPPQLEYLKALSEQIEAFVDREVFQEAAAELKTGKNRSLDSLYAQQLLSFLEQQ